MQQLKLLVVCAALIAMGGCAPPTKFEYRPQSITQHSNVQVQDKRPMEQRSYRVERPGGTRYLYGDENFNIGLMEILQDRLATQLPPRKHKYTVKVLSLVLSVYNAAGSAPPNSGLAVGLMEVNPAATIFETPLSRLFDESGGRSVWCDLMVEIDGHQLKAGPANYVRTADLLKAVLDTYLEAIDQIAVQAKSIPLKGDAGA